jgi:hypothetical protein
MAGESVVGEVTRPLGSVGIELGLTRVELLELADRQIQMGFDYISWAMEITFAFIIATFFIAHRLSRSQFFFLLAAYTLFICHNFEGYLITRYEVDFWLKAAGMIVSAPEFAGIAYPVETIPFLLYATFYVGSIWWAISCRRNQPKEIGSPL